jgi:hypothetical protein
MNVTLVRYTGLEPQRDTNTTASFAWRVKERNREGNQTPTKQYEKDKQPEKDIVKHYE